MKKIISLILAALMLFVACAALAEAPEGYPEIPEGLDFGGQTVYFYDWWSNGERMADPDPDTAKLYEYRDWIQEQCNVTIVETALSDWAGNPTELANIVMNQDNSKLCLVMLASDFIGSAIANDLTMPWVIDMSAEKWTPTDLKFVTKNDKIMGVHTGKVEPRSCIFFNKRVLTEAGINPETLYDAQADGTWDWAMMEEMMKKVTRDTDNDGVNDVYGITGSGDDACIALVMSNGATFFDYDENGKLQPTVGSDAGLEALQTRIDWWNNYAAPQPEGSNWDWFKDYWKQG
ncbi:MAG: hypothetical protein MJ142_03740, partial [Clostridia bacterium]|nr:hypothetical protein [Clostridia bacterium]